MLLGGLGLLLAGGLAAFVLRRSRPAKAPLPKVAAAAPGRSRLSEDADVVAAVPTMPAESAVSGQDESLDATAPSPPWSQADPAGADQAAEAAESVDVAEPEVASEAAIREDDARLDDAPPDEGSQDEAETLHAIAPASPEAPVEPVELAVDEAVALPDVESAEVSPPADQKEREAAPVQQPFAVTDSLLRRQLEDAVFAAPGDLDRHLTLLRQIYQSGDEGAFRAAAVAMKANVQDDTDPRWREVVVLGMGLMPGDPLFREGQWNPASVADRAAPAAGEAVGEQGAEDTRLELARAYIEIGDIEGARAMLEEVRADGAAAARQDAERLLRELG